jgi:diadenosine tetraphosphate (Ap4A) HIT family hydrolase
MTMVNNSEYNVSKACRSVDTASTSNREPRRYTAYEVHVHVVVRTRDKTLDPSKMFLNFKQTTYKRQIELAFEKEVGAF